MTEADQWVADRVREIERDGSDWLGRSAKLWAEAYVAVVRAAEGPVSKTERLRAAACRRWLRS